MSTTTLLVRQDQLGSTRIETREDEPLADGQIRVRVDSFALTSNNITYAAFGEAMNYWQFYPDRRARLGHRAGVGLRHRGAVAASGRGGGRATLWLLAHGQPGRAATRPPDGLRLQRRRAASRPTARALQPVPAMQRRPVLHAPDSEDVQAILRPLFITSWLIDDFLADNDFFGARTVLLSSASSKTAYGTAFQLQPAAGHRGGGPDLAGQPARSAKAWAATAACSAYDELDQLPADTPCVYIDFAGNAQLRRAIHTRFANLKLQLLDRRHPRGPAGRRQGFAGPARQLFFAPAQVKKRQAEWGAAELGKRLVEAWHAFSAKVCDADAPWLQVQHHHGPEAVQAAYAQVLAGRGDPRQGHILSPALRRRRRQWRHVRTLPTPMKPHARRRAGRAGQRRPVRRRPPAGAELLREPRLPGPPGGCRTRASQPWSPSSIVPAAGATAQILEEHAFAAELMAAEVPAVGPLVLRRHDAASPRRLRVQRQPAPRRPRARARRRRGAGMDRPLPGAHPHRRRRRGRSPAGPRSTCRASAWSRATGCWRTR